MKLENTVLEIAYDKDKWIVVKVNDKPIAKKTFMGQFSSASPEWKDGPPLYEYLNKLGQEGWETVDRTGNAVILQRQIKQDTNMKFEYMTVEHFSQRGISYVARVDEEGDVILVPDRRLLDYLQEIGREGWQICTNFQDGNSFDKFFLMRQIE